MNRTKLLENGLTSDEANLKLKQNGFNEVPESQVTFISAIISRLWEPSAWILEGALVIEIILGKTIQAGFIILMLIFAALNGAVQSQRANRVLRSLSKKLIPNAIVYRSKKWQIISARNLVVGDVVSLRTGDIIPADVKVLTQSIEVDESTVTGESNAVEVRVEETALSGTEIIRGNTTAVVTATGVNSRYGKTISLINRSSTPGHLQIILGKVVGNLAILDAILAIVLVVVAIIRHENLIDMLPFLAMLFIATIPIAMPSSFSVANSVEANVLSQAGILTSDLTGIQNAANLNILLIDKTGTITENKPVVVKFYPLDMHFSSERIIQLAVSATDQQNISVIDAAIIKYAKQNKVTMLQRQKFEPFNSDKGFSEAIVEDTASIKLGSYKKLSESVSNIPDMSVDIDFTAGRTVAVTYDDKLVGLFVMQDQPRADSATAIQAIRNRGVKVIMLTGDNQKTAESVAHGTGIEGQIQSYSKSIQLDNISDLAGISDVVPENKLAIVKQLQSAGYMVGMTGDGVNDAPALKQADVGIAVNDSVDVAKRSADLILLTDGLMPIIKILDSGHRVYQRMMTWTITKLSRTAELTILLTLGYLIFGFIPLSINAMVLVAIQNDLVTLVLGTDHTTITHHPESWNIIKISRVATILAAEWTIVGFGWLLWLVHQGYLVGEISSLLYVYLIVSAMLTILITRTKHLFWRSNPSNAVKIAIVGNILLTVGLVWSGLGITRLSPLLVLLAVALTFFVGIIIAKLNQLFAK